MRTLQKALLSLSMTALLLVSCGTTSKVPITGRTQRLLVTDEQVLSLSNEQYSSYMKTAKASTNANNTAMVKRVGQRIADAVVTYLKANGYEADAQTYQWAFNLVQEAQVNAFCMPGGKIVVYEGLLPVTQDETSLAIVLGHEVAHAVAKHSAEQMSNALKQQYAAQAASILLSSVGAGEGLTQTASTVFGIGSAVGRPAFSRKHESEADHLGLIFAAMAGYDPAQAIPFWQRMAAQSNGAANSIFSDHPSDQKRIADLQKWLPEAQQYYKPVQTTTKSTTKTTTKKTTTKTTTKKTTTKKK